MRNASIPAAAIAAAIMIVGPVNAQQVQSAALPPSMPDATVNTQTALNNQIAILTDELQVAKLQKQIADTTKKSTQTATADPNITSSFQTDTNTLPTVLSILGRGDNLTATLQLPSGTQIPAYRGLGLPGGLTIYSITARGVQVMSAGNLVTLPFASTTSTEASARSLVTPVIPPFRQAP